MTADRSIPSLGGRRAALGLAACGFYAVHAAYHWRAGQPENALWVCHLASLLIGAGLILRLPTCNAIGVLLLLIGCPLWLLSILGGDELLPSSLLTHVGGLLVGLIGVKLIGLPRGTWWKAALVVAALLAVSAVLRPESNVNLVQHPWAGWESWYPIAPLYHVQLLLQWTAGLFVAELLLSRAFLRSARERTVESQ